MRARFQIRNDVIDLFWFQAKTKSRHFAGYALLNELSQDIAVGIFPVHALQWRRLNLQPLLLVGRHVTQRAILNKQRLTALLLLDQRGPRCRARSGGSSR